MVPTKQIVGQLTSELMALTPDENGQPSAVSLNQLADEISRAVVNKYGGELQSIHGAVAIAYAVARFLAPAVVATAKTKADLTENLHTVTDLVSTVIRMSLETAWQHAHGQGQELIVSVPLSPKA